MKRRSFIRIFMILCLMMYMMMLISVQKILDRADNALYTSLRDGKRLSNTANNSQTVSKENKNGLYHDSHKMKKRDIKKIVPETNCTGYSRQVAPTTNLSITKKHNPLQTSNDCQPLSFSKGWPKTALVSFPGSGNTWARHLVQQLSGAFTGSIYRDGLLMKKFPGEGKKDDSVVAIKTHEPLWNHNDGVTFQRAILVIRNPFDALKAEYTRRSGMGHNKEVVDPSNYFHKRKRDWGLFLNGKRPNSASFVSMHGWMYSTIEWLTEFPGHLIVVHYEQLKKNLKSQLIEIASFLKINVTQSLLDCIICSNSDGGFKRRHRTNETFDPFDNRTKAVLNHYVKIVETTLESVCYTDRVTCVDDPVII
ncbi:unnamed protein product [Owenia fusiformis]|uniref:Sulfotransferase domain-containing protein n=1 Tax=Owenia fusiformis TaxID=6347 RepID=A0A8J1TH02_OWEFU|nr:unnamed protein product [Owenia fusiformis]